MNQPGCTVSTPVEQPSKSERDALYRAYFDCFNRERFFEAHEVLESLWRAEREGPNAAFYKGLIQLAGAFVHLQKQRLRPAAALFRLAQGNLEHYPAVHLNLDVAAVRGVVLDWLRRLEERDFAANPLTPGAAPKCRLEHTPNLPGG